MPEISPSKAKHLVRHLVKAGLELEGGRKTREDLKEQLVKVKKLAVKKVRKPGLIGEIEKLEDMILKVANLEREILSKEDKDVKDLKNQMQELRVKLSLTESGELKKSLDRISFLIGELVSRVDSFVGVRMERQQRLEELEKKIKERLRASFKEILTMEKHIFNLENKYDELKKGGDYSKEHLKIIENRLDELRGKLIEKRAEIVEKRKEEIREKFKEDKFVPPPQFVYPGKEPVKHKMLFPQMPQVEEELPPPPSFKRKGFLSKIRNVFRRKS